MILRMSQLPRKVLRHWRDRGVMYQKAFHLRTNAAFRARKRFARQRRVKP